VLQAYLLLLYIDSPLALVPDLPSNIRLRCKELQKANTLAYLPEASANKKKSFIALTPGRIPVLWQILQNFFGHQLPSGSIS
jgi:hypothetical protein